MDIRYLNIKHPSDDPTDRYSIFNVRHPSDHLQDEYLIFEYQTSILPTPRWIFNIKCPQIDTVKQEMFANN